MCTHNAGRSQMAAALLAREGGDAVRVTSAGSEPASQVNPASATSAATAGTCIFARLRYTRGTCAVNQAAQTLAGVRQYSGVSRLCGGCVPGRADGLYLPGGCPAGGALARRHRTGRAHLHGDSPPHRPGRPLTDRVGRSSIRRPAPPAQQSQPPDNPRATAPAATALWAGVPPVRLYWPDVPRGQNGYGPGDPRPCQAVARNSRQAACYQALPRAPRHPPRKPHQPRNRETPAVLVESTYSDRVVFLGPGCLPRRRCRRFRRGGHGHREHPAAKAVRSRVGEYAPKFLICESAVVRRDGSCGGVVIAVGR